MEWRQTLKVSQFGFTSSPIQIFYETEEIVAIARFSPTRQSMHMIPCNTSGEVESQLVTHKKERTTQILRYHFG